MFWRMEAREERLRQELRCLRTSREVVSVSVRRNNWKRVLNVEEGLCGHSGQAS